MITTIVVGLIIIGALGLLVLILESLPGDINNNQGEK